MPSAFERQPNDLGLHSVPPKSVSDPRVRLAEEDALQAEISAWLSKNSREARWLTPLNIAIEAGNQAVISGKYYSEVYPSASLNVNARLVIPALDSTSSVVKRIDRLYLVIFGSVVGGDHDPLLGKVDFQYITRPVNTLTPVQKENAKRDRVFWCLAITQEILTPESFNNLLPITPLATGQLPSLTGDRYMQVKNLTPEGFKVGVNQIYALDPNLIVANYPVLKNFVECVPICEILRIQNFTDRGYTWGLGGEEPLVEKFTVRRNRGTVQVDLQEAINERLSNIFEGKIGSGTTYLRTVQNLTSGSVPGNPGKSGEAAGSPDGSSCLSNDQRSGFSNEPRIRKYSVTFIPSASNDGSGRAVVTVGLNTNVPLGTTYSENPADHKIYALDGSDQTAFGSFTSLGGAGYLTWVGAPGNTAITPGSQCFVVPGVRNVPGSGLSIPFIYPEAVYYSAPGVATRKIDPANVRVGCDDIGHYEDPANNEVFIVLLGRERMALHYIYKKVTLRSDAAGVLRIPSSERGCFAFVSGVSGRIDKPVVTGVAASTDFDTLIYYPPRSSESWQFQLVYPEYQGLGDEAGWLNGAVIISTPLLFAHTQGGGLSVFRGSAELRYSPIAFYLPEVSGEIEPYELNQVCELPGEINPGPGATFRPLPISCLLPAPGLSIPSVGQVLTLLPGIQNQPRSIKGGLAANGFQIGFRTPVLQGEFAYQYVLCFAVRKNDQIRLVIVTRNTRGGESIPVQSDSNVAFDLFKLY